MYKERLKLGVRVSACVLGILFALVLILFVPLSFFEMNLFYTIGYGLNGAYERLGEERVWDVTHNFKDFLLEGEALLYFEGEEREHLLEVKDVYLSLRSVLLQGLFLSVFGILGICFFAREVLWLLFRSCGACLGIVLGVLGILGAFWQWFFRSFHEVFFESTWMFSYDTLTIMLWRSPFFEIAFGIMAFVLLGFALGSWYLGNKVKRMS